MDTETSSQENSSQPVALQANGLGLSSLIIGIVAAVLAFIPLINYVIGFVAFVGLVLGVVAIFLKGKKKKVAVAGTVVSFVALILAISLAISYTQSFVDSVSTPATVVSPESNDEENAEGSEEPAAQEGGTRDNPLPIGTTITIGAPGSPEWEVTVGPATLDATELVLNENRFNDPPKDGFQYALLNLTVTYVGETSGTPWVALNVSYVGSDAVTYRSSDTYAVAPNSLFDVNELFPGGTGSGNILVAIPSGIASEGTWRVGASFLGDDLFFSAQ